MPNILKKRGVQTGRNQRGGLSSRNRDDLRQRLIVMRFTNCRVAKGCKVDQDSEEGMARNQGENDVRGDMRDRIIYL